MVVNEYKGTGEVLRESGVTILITKDLSAYSSKQAMELFFCYMEEQGELLSMKIDRVDISR